ncbi:hypothetical protein HNY73_007284 [Argiope bruennichi]|uniref:Uncharacterized protein n=1 Tax=Argiope bruennichi TaxID=94029 RepID=A0A8T0FKH1_ARGBR|nr:hypothetical protein HNY73_007284 [Argiope bruennichi]
MHLTDKKSKKASSAVNEQSNVSQASDFQQRRPKIFSKQACSKEIVDPPCDSGACKCETSQSKRTVDHKSSYTRYQNVDSRKIGGRARSPRCSRRTSKRKKNHILSAKKKFSQINFPLQYFPGYHSNVNPALLLHGSPNPVQNQVCAYPRQYPENRIWDQNIVMSQNYPNPLPVHLATYPHNLQGPLLSVRAAAQPVVLMSHSREPHLNPMPSIMTNAAPMRYPQHSTVYQTRMPPTKTNTTNMQYTKRSSHYKNHTPRFSTNAKAMRHFQPPQATTPIALLRIQSPQGVIQNRFFSSPKIPDQDLKFSAIQPQNPAPQGTISHHTVTSNVEQSKNVMKFEEFAKRAHYSKKNMLSIEIPPAIKSFFPLYSTPQNEIAVRQLQYVPIQFPTPAGYICFGSSIGMRRAIIPHQSYQYMRASHQSAPYSFPYVPPVVTGEVSPVLAVKDNVLNQYGSQAFSSIHSGIQVENITSCGEQHQPVVQNLIAAQQYQDPKTTCDE